MIIERVMTIFNKRNKIDTGVNVRIGRKTAIMEPQNIHIGNNSYVNGGFLFAGKNSKIIIGNNCLISYNVHIRTSTHNYRNKTKLIREQGNVENNIVIQDDCWIGFGAQIMPGITIAEGCVIGAGSIVTKNTEPYSVYVGIPARKISERT